MNICHCMFFYRSNKIISVLRKNTGMEVIKFGGENYIEYSEKFWDSWVDYAGCTGDSVLDFCIIYDAELEIPEKFRDRICDSSYSIWSKSKVKETIEKFIDIKKPTAFYDEKGCIIFKSGALHEKENILKMKARYIKADAEEKKEDYSQAKKITPFIEDMLNELKKYDSET